VLAHRVDRELEAGRNLLTRQAVGEQDQNFELARRKLDAPPQGLSVGSLTLKITPKTPSTFPARANGTELIRPRSRQPSGCMRFRSKFVTCAPSNLLVKVSRARVLCSGATMKVP